MRERREIAAGTDRTFLRNHRRNAAIVQLAEQLDDFQTNAAQTQRKHIGPQQDQGADFRFGERVADTAGMTAHQVQLQLTQFIGWNMNIRELAEAGAYAIDD